MLNTFLLSMLLVCIVTVSAEYALPYIRNHYTDGSWVKWATAFITLLLMLPFLYALAVRNTNSIAYREVLASNRYNGRLNLIHFFRLILAGSFIGFLMHRFSLLRQGYCLYW